MTRSPLLNALSAIAYIAVVASIIFYGTRHLGPTNSVIVPLAMISLFTLSAAVMGYLFCITPASFILRVIRKMP